MECTETNGEPPPPPPPPPPPEQQQVIKSSIDHSRDEISQQSIEQLEMQRLGLPCSFSSSKGYKWRANKSSKNHRRGHPSPADQSSYYYDGDENGQNHDEEGEEEMICEEEEMEPDNVDDSVEEMATVKLSAEPFDFLDLDKLKISPTIEPNDDDDNVSNNNKNNPAPKRSHDDDMASVASREEFSEESAAWKKPPERKKKKRQKPKRDSRHNRMNHQEGPSPYWKQRFVLFSRFAEGIKLDHESWYSVTPEPIARHIARRIELALFRAQRRRDGRFIFLDAFCGAGGNTIQFALLPSTALVYAVDIDPKKIELARHNATIYGCVDKIQFIVADFFQVIQSDRLPLSLVDVCFLSPPWGGPDYNKYPTYTLNQMIPNGFDIARLASAHVTRNISFLLPRNFDTTELESLARIVYQPRVGKDADAADKEEKEKEKIRVEIEENLLYKKVKTLTAYFGDLVDSA